ncbi:MAG: isopeptide-forming domain-containing fimbrial protein [Ruminococcus sp.]|nr:isopeptide-forming domain-containing fimbrial protein [Ruminococcus sp.]
MKKFNRIAAAVAATLMAASLSIPMAASLPASASDYQITISETATDGTTVTNETYTAYRIFDVEYDTGKSAYTYTIPSNPLLTLNEIITAAQTADSSGASGIITMDDLSAWLTSDDTTDAIVRAFADALWEALEEKGDLSGSSYVYTSSDNVIDTETAGYFLVAGSSTVNNETIASLVALTTTDPTGTINPKLTAPTLDKQVEEDGTYGDYASSQIGDTVKYKITTTMPDPAYVQQFGTNGDDYSYVIHDTMSEGLTFNKDDIKITIDGAEISTSCYTLTVAPNTSDDCTFEIDFDMAKIIEDYSAVAVSGADIVVTYTCTLNDKALVAASTSDSTNHNDNGAKLEYSNNPYDSTTTTTPEEKVYDWSFYETITKVNSAEEYLAGAEFEIYNGDTLLYFLKAGDGSETYTIVPAGTNNAVSTITSTADGGFTIKGLDESVVYTVKEVTVPDGYTGSDDSTFKLTAKYNDSYTELTDLYDDYDVDGPNNLNIVNTSGTIFPFTGGMGTTLFYIGGGCLVAVAGVFLIAKKRMSKRED